MKGYERRRYIERIDCYEGREIARRDGNARGDGNILDSEAIVWAVRRGDKS